MPAPTRGAAISAALIGLIALIACAPATTAPPPVPLADDQIREVGLSAGAGAFVFYTRSCPGNPYADCRTDVDLSPAIDGMFWYRRSRARWDHGFSAGLGSSSLNLGGFARVRLNGDPERRYVGLQLDAGILWASLGVPLSMELQDGLWIYTNPSFGLRWAGPLYVPVGLNKTLNQRSALNVELLYRGEVGPLTSLGYYDAPILTASAGWSRRF